MATVVNEDRQYQRILPSDASILILDSAGLEWVFSSNVSAAARRGNNLIIRFHNGSMYSYAGQGKNFERLMGAASKGKWVWRFLRRPRVAFTKIGSLPLPEDTAESDLEILEPRIATYDVRAILPTTEQMLMGVLPQISISPLAILSGVTNNGFAGNLLVGLLVSTL